MKPDEVERLRPCDQVSREVYEQFTIQQGIVERRPLGMFTEIGDVTDRPVSGVYWTVQFGALFEPLSAIDWRDVKIHCRREDRKW